MGISTKSTYGIRAMLELALYYEKGPVSATFISDKENISITYLEQLLLRLRKKGLVKSMRGSRGGYLLAKKPDNITIGEIVRKLDGDITPVHCISGQSNRKSCKAENKCVTRIFWKKLKNAVDDTLDSVTLKDLCNDAKKMDIDRTIEHKYVFHI